MTSSMSMRRGGRMLLAAVVVTASLLAGFSAQRATAQPAPPGSLEFLCASPWTRAVYYQPNGCTPGNITIDLTAGEVTLCWNNSTGQLLYTWTGACTPGTAPLTLGGEASLTLCASPYTGIVSYGPSGVCPGGTLPLTTTGFYSADCLTAGDCPQQISEYYGTGSVDDILTVAGSTGTVTDVNVTVELLAEDLTDVNLTLTSPLGTAMLLFEENNPCMGVEHLQVVFDDEGAALDCGALTGSNAYQPVGSLTDFDGEDANGSWTLTIETTGVTGGDAGILVNWGLTITTTGTGADVACPVCMVPYPNALVDPTGGAALSSLTASPPANDQIADVNVTVDISHTDVSELHLFVISPAGTVVRLLDQSCGGSDDLEVVYDDEAASGLNCPDRLGFNSFQPVGALSTFDGESVTGTWHLVALDDAQSGQGTLNDWALDFTLN